MTVRTLILLRHAKAERPAGLPDLDRPLTDRGHADAAVAGAWLAAHGYVPDLVICSPAKRTRQTWHGIALALSVAPTVQYERKAYDSGAHDLLTHITMTDGAFTTVVLVGHNPTVSQVSALLDPAGTAGDSDGLRTSGLAVHVLEGSWAQCAPGAARLTATHTARA